MATYAPNQLRSVPLAELQPDPTQPRKYLDPLALEELTASVGQVGIIEPIVCRQARKSVHDVVALNKYLKNAISLLDYPGSAKKLLAGWLARWGIQRSRANGWR
jgi:hypothetical protein